MRRKAPPGHVLNRSVVLLAVAVAVAVGAQPATAKQTPNLRVDSISASSTTVVAGATLSVRDTVGNRGSSRAAASTTRFYLSRDGDRGESDIRLRGKRVVRSLRPGKGSTGESMLAVPLRTPPVAHFLIGCADDRKQIDERNEENNCRAAVPRVTVALPEDCTDRLTTLGIAFEAGPSRPGVMDPVTVQTPISGITYGSAGAGNDPELFMDCTLALALDEMAAEMTARGLTHVEQAGIYSYRCIGGGTPPDCPNGISRHAYADAIDIRELRSPTETYNVNDDWVINSDPTCVASTSAPKDALLHSFTCALHAAGTFHVVLTPNYNNDHRDHFHLDVTPSFSFID